MKQSQFLLSVKSQEKFVVRKILHYHSDTPVSGWNVKVTFGLGLWEERKFRVK